MLCCQFLLAAATHPQRQGCASAVEWSRLTLAELRLAAIHHQDLRPAAARSLARRLLADQSRRYLQICEETCAFFTMLRGAADARRWAARGNRLADHPGERGAAPATLQPPSPVSDDDEHDGI
jgi:predicted RNA-binding Zn ribbon-like protein